MKGTINVTENNVINKVYIVTASFDNILKEYL